MRTSPRPPRRRSMAAIVASAALLLLAAAPAFAKEGMEARLDAPIAMGTPGGTEILVGMTVTVFDENGVLHPVEGTPVYLKLIGRDGATTRAAGAGDRTPGHYMMRIAIPEGGARDLEIGIHGTSDLAIMVLDDTFVFGDITPATAQLAPPLAPALTPFPRASTPVVAGAPAVQPVTRGASVVPMLLAGGLVIATLLVITGLLVAIRHRRVVAPTARVPAGPRGTRDA